MKHLLLALAAALPISTGALAQDTAAAPENNDLRVRVGVGAQLQPKFIGDDGTSISPLFHVNTARGDHEFKFGAPDDHFGLSVVSSGGFSFGPAGNLQGSRKNSDVGAQVGKVSTTVEAGAFAQYEWNDSFRFRAELLKGLNGHKGLVGMVGADKIWRDGDRYVFSVGPRVMFSNARYQRAYFGVSPDASLATGLPIYRPSGGIHGVALASGASYQFNNRWGVFGYARYERLVRDAAKSPIVREFGSRNQLAGGLGLNYTFTLHR